MFGCAGRHSENRGVSSSTLQVNSRADLVTAHQKLDDAGIPHREVTDLGDAGLAILSFSDPDGVHLELTAPLS